MTVPEQPAARTGEPDAAALPAAPQQGGIPEDPAIADLPKTKQFSTDQPVPPAAPAAAAQAPGLQPPQPASPQPGFAAPPYPAAGYPQQAGQPPQYPYQQYPQYGQYPYPYGYPQQQSGTNGMAIAAMVCGLCGFLCGVTGLVGMILGIVSLPQIKRSGQSGRGMAITGIVAGSIWIVLFILVIVFGHHGQQIGNSTGGDGSGGTSV